MSKCIYKEIADKLDKDELIEYYETHLPKDVAEHFGFELIYFYRIFDYLGIKRRTAAENTIILFKYYDMTERNKKVGQSNVGRLFSQETLNKISESNKGKHTNLYELGKPYHFKKGNISPKKGKPGKKWSLELHNKYDTTMRDRGWYNKSKQEEFIYQLLLSIYDKDDIVRWYKDKERYPFYCDFYIKSEDLFIEYNGWWHHGPKPYDSDDEELNELLLMWKEKSIANNLYEKAIYIWTQRDVDKLNCMTNNKLNYIVIYPNYTCGNKLLTFTVM